MLAPQVLKSLLVPRGLVEEEVFANVVERAQHARLSVEEVLAEQRILDELKLGEVIAEWYHVPFVNLRERVLTPDVVRHVPEPLARNKHLVLYDIRDGKGFLAMVNPHDPETVNALSRSLHLPLEVAYATDRAIAEALRLYQKELPEEFADLIKGNLAVVEQRAGTVTAEDLPIARIVDTIVTYAYQYRASDVHLEPMTDAFAVRFRIDGILRDVLSASSTIYEFVVTRIKILSRLRTDEHFAAQDGKFRLNVGEEELDVRVSILPTTYGEKIVMRLLSQRQRRLTLEDLGMEKEDLKKVWAESERPHGMILSTGPTGCGKTTTLYALLQTLNTREVNITTIEDPVEYNIAGVAHIQVNPRTNLTFANGLRSILRQDPDIIMVGEVRDEETAKIAVNAALTGHLVLSTLHTNDAPTTLPRLLDMGVEPFLVASSVNVAIGQRLVRRLCAQCRKRVPITPAQREALLASLPKESTLRGDGEKQSEVFVGSGCPSCTGAGYTGRVGIFEVLVMDEEIRSHIVAKASADEIRKVARRQGMTTMLEDGLSKAFRGITTIDEVLRATKE